MQLSIFSTLCISSLFIQNATSSFLLTPSLNESINASKAAENDALQIAGLTHCTSSPDWLPFNFQDERNRVFAAEWQRAARMIRRDEKLDGGWIEFLSTNASSSYGFTVQVRTPRRFISGRVTIAIANFLDIPLEYLPDAPTGPFEDAGLDSYANIRLAQKQVAIDCAYLQAGGPYKPWVLQNNEVGWGSVGELFTSFYESEVRPES